MIIKKFVRTSFRGTNRCTCLFGDDLRGCDEPGVLHVKIGVDENAMAQCVITCEDHSRALWSEVSDFHVITDNCDMPGITWHSSGCKVQ